MRCLLHRSLEEWVDITTLCDLAVGASSVRATAFLWTSQLSLLRLSTTVWLAGQRNECWRDGGDLFACESNLRQLQPIGYLYEQSV